MTLLEQLMVPPSWSASDGRRKWVTRTLSPAGHSSRGQLLLLIAGLLLAWVETIREEASKGAHGHVTTALLLGVVVVAPAAQRAVEARRNSPG